MTNQKTTDLSPELKVLLEQLRHRIRSYVWWQGLAITIAILGIAFWVGLAADWIFEPSPGMRLAAIGAVAALLLYVIYRSILCRAFVKLSDTSMAVLLERQYEAFDDSLLTSVEAAQTPERAQDFSREMLDFTHQRALEHSRDVLPAKVFNFVPLKRNLILAAALVVSIVTFGVLASGAFGFWIQRIALTDQPWPRRTQLLVEGFEPGEDGVRSVKVARDSDFELIVKAAAMLEDPPPREVQIRYRLADGSRGRELMDRVGEAIPGRDEYQVYQYTFPTVAAPIAFDVVGGDDRIEDLRLDVVERPHIVEMTLDCTFPKYIGREPRQLTVTGNMQLPDGTRVVVQARTNKDLDEVSVHTTDSSDPIRLDIKQQPDRRAFEFDVSSLRGDEVLLFSLMDQDGIESREPYRLSLSPIVDEAPRVAVGLKGIGTAVTPSARIPTVGKVTDDYGLKRIWFRHFTSAHKSHTVEFQSQPNGQNKFQANQVLDTRDFDDANKLQPGQRLTLSIEASDQFDLDDPHIGSSQRFLLNVVTPDQLRSILERRELTLRRRFETVVDEMTDTRDLITRVDFSGDEGADQPPSTPQPSSDGNTTTVTGGTSSDRAASRRRLRTDRGIQNVQRAAHATLGVATAFDELREELVNNRIDTEELNRRLQDDISAPLKQLGEDSMPQLEERLKRVLNVVEDREAGSALQEQAIADADRILVEMKQILEKMLELESYNEVLDLLRGIIKDQEALNARTKDERKKKLQDLLK